MIALLNRDVSLSGAAMWHHLRSLYPIPVKPGAEELDVQARLFATSSSVMSRKGCDDWMGGSSGWTAGIGTGTEGKNRSARTAWIVKVDVAKLPSDVRRGGMWLTWRPWCHQVTVQSRSAVVWSKKSTIHTHFAFWMVWRSSLIAGSWDLPLVTATQVRAASHRHCNGWGKPAGFQPG